MNRLTIQPLSPTRGDCPLVCDVESLLLDPAPAIAHALHLTLADYGLPAPQWPRARLRHTPVAALLRGALHTVDRATLAEACARYQLHQQVSGRYAAQLWPGSLQLLAALACEPRFDVHYLTHIGAEAAARLLDHYGLSHHVRSIITPEAEHCAGIRPALLRALLDQQQYLPPAHWLMLSDHPLQLHEASQLGLRTLGLAYGRGSLAALAPIEPDLMSMNPVDVECRLAQWAGAAPTCRARPLHLRLH